MNKYCWIKAKLFVALLWMANTGLMWVGSIAFAADTQNDFSLLVAQDQVKLKVWVEPDNNIIVSQQVNLFIEVSTLRWFAGGTQIGQFDGEGAVVLRREKFAVNSTRREGGETWATQLWTVAIYPQRNGMIEVPTIALTLTVAGEDNQPVTGTLLTPKVSFSATVPVAMQGQSEWIATSQFDVEERYDKPSDNLKAGDSLLRTIRFNARDVAAMMLPAPTFQSQPGLAVYHKPAEIKDRVNRGDYLATRTESISYFIERDGRYQLPALEFHWWNIQQQEMLTVRLPAKVISASGETEVLPAATDQPGLMGNAGSGLSIIDGIIVLVAMGGLLVLVFLGHRILSPRFRQRQQHRATLTMTQPTMTQLTMAQLQRQFVRACRNTEYSTAVVLLYQWLDHSEHQISGARLSESSVRVWLNRLGEDQLMDQFNQLMNFAWGNEGGHGDDGRGNGGGNGGGDGWGVCSEFENLLVGLNAMVKDTGSLFGFGEAVDLRLN